MKIAFLTIATNKYIQYAENLLSTLNDFAFKNTKHQVDLFVFTNIPELFRHRFMRINTHGVMTTHVPFPLVSLLRYHYYASCDALKDYDYLYHIDCDMLMQDVVSEEIFGDSTCVIHPGFYGQNINPSHFPYDRASGSNAYVQPGIGTHYYQNCFQGGKALQFLNMCNVLRNRIEEDLRKNYIALWHDESYMNRYMIENPPTTILSPVYAQPQNWASFGPTKIMHVDKNHLEVRKT